jgi:AraC-like DNA-binding protein
MYREHPPAPALRAHVVCYWTMTSPARVGPGPAVESLRVLPDGCMDLLFALQGGRAEPALIGAMSRARVVPRELGAGFAGVRFRPGEALAFVDVDAADARDAVLAPGEAGIAGAEAVAERLARATPSAWPRVLEGWLLENLGRARACDRRVRRAVALLAASGGAARVGPLAAEVGLSERQLERAFAERVGLTPKLLARVLRLQALVGRLEHRVAVRSSGAGLAAALGFADQAHLVRDVRALTGVTPTVLVRERVSVSFKTGDEPSGIVAP